MTIDYTEQGRRALYFTAAVAPKWLQLERWGLHHAACLLAGIDPDPASPFKPNIDDGYVMHAISSRLTSPDEFGEWSSRAGMWRSPREWLERGRRAGIPIPECLVFEAEQNIAKPFSEPEPKKVRRQETQESEILRVIRELGHDPKAMPQNSPGKPGVKSLVKRKLATWTNSVFEKAWGRLRTHSAISDA